MKAFFIGLVGLLLTGSVANAADIVLFRDASEMRVKVVKVDWSKITYMIAGQPQTKPLDKIAKIDFEKKPTQIVQGQRAFQGGYYVKAASYYIKASKLPSKPYFWAKDYGMYYAALSYFHAEEYDKALSMYQKLIDSNSSTRWLAEAQLGMVDCAIKKADIAKAKQLLKKFNSGKSAKKMEYYRKLGELAEARIMMASKKYKEASKLFRRVSSSTKRAYPNIYTRAQLGMAQALIFNKDFAKARKKIEDFMAKCPKTVKPEALNTLGDCYFEEAKTKTGKEKDALIEEARWRYLRVFVLYPYSTESIRAKFYAAKCFLALSAKEKSAKARAKALNKEILKRAPKSEWALKIKKGK